MLDSLGREDALKRNYHLDLAPAVAALKARGFYVAEGARSNYSQTYLSLASTLNADYLDDVARAVGPTTTDRAPLHYLIQENALMRMASRAGYRIVAFGSDYMATEQVNQADVCFCSLSGLDELESAAIALTPLAAVPIGGLAGADLYEAHRRKVVDTFATLEAYQRGPGRTFVFAHVLAPHPPFVLARDGSPLASPAKPFSLADWRDEAEGAPAGVHQRIRGAVALRARPHDGDHRRRTAAARSPASHRRAWRSWTGAENKRRRVDRHEHAPAHGDLSPLTISPRVIPGCIRR